MGNRTNFYSRNLFLVIASVLVIFLTACEENGNGILIVDTNTPAFPTQTSTTDIERPLSDIEKNLIGKWYLNYRNNYHQTPDSEGNVDSIEFYKNQTFTYTSYSYSYNEDVRYCNSNNATGTWSLEGDKILLNYSDGDYEKIGKLSDVVLRNDILACNHIWYYGSEYSYTDEEIYKKTKWSFENRMPEPASATQALIGEWTMSSRNGLKISPDLEGNMPKTIMYSDHTYYSKAIVISSLDDFYTTNNREYREVTGKWYYEFGVLYFEEVRNNNVYEGCYKINISNNSLIMISYYEPDGEAIYEMTKTSSDSSD